MSQRGDVGFGDGTGGKGAGILVFGQDQLAFAQEGDRLVVAGCIPVVADDLPVVVDMGLDDAALNGLDVLALQLPVAALVAAVIHFQQLRHGVAGG